MSNNGGEILTEAEDAFGEMRSEYELDGTEYDDNEDEGTVEYLDLDLEVDSIPESAEEYIPETPASRTKAPVIQSSVLKRSYIDEVKLKRSRQSATVARTKSASSISNRNVASRAAKGKIDSLASVTIHAAVNAINAKLADSAQAINGRGRSVASHAEGISHSAVRPASSDDSQSSQGIKTDVKSEGDSLDLFFQSMAQTVLNLPSQVQAKIKMDICKVIAMAEIKYCSLDAASDDNKF